MGIHIREIRIGEDLKVRVSKGKRVLLQVSPELIPNYDEIKDNYKKLREVILEMILERENNNA